VRISAALSWHSVGPILTAHGRITARDYVDTLSKQECPRIQTILPSDDAVLREDSAGTVLA
jgi:hypothetical protein